MPLRYESVVVLALTVLKARSSRACLWDVSSVGAPKKSKRGAHLQRGKGCHYLDLQQSEPTAVTEVEASSDVPASSSAVGPEPAFMSASAASSGASVASQEKTEASLPFTSCIEDAPPETPLQPQGLPADVDLSKEKVQEKGAASSFAGGSAFVPGLDLDDTSESEGNKPVPKRMPPSGARKVASEGKVPSRAVKQAPIPGLKENRSSDESSPGSPTAAFSKRKQRGSRQSDRIAKSTAEAAEAARQFQPSAVDPSTCQALLWNGGRGRLQCQLLPMTGTRLCKRHQKAPHGEVRGPIPAKKFDQFCAQALKPYKDSKQWYSRYLMWAAAAEIAPGI